MAKRRLILPVLLVALAGGLGGGFWYWWSHLRFIESTDDAFVMADITQVSAKIGGRATGVLVRDHQSVTKGDVLVTIDDADIRSRLEVSIARIREREAATAVIDQQIQQAEAAMAQAKAEVDWAEAERKRIEQDFKRDKQLNDQKLIPTTRYDSIAADRQKIAATLTRNRAALDIAEQNREVLKASRTQAQSAIQSAEAEADLVKLDLEQMVIRAPVSGVVGNRSVQDGEIVRAGVTLLSIVPLDAVWIEANFKETQIESMRPGQKVEIEVDAFPDLALTGAIESLSPASGANFSLLPPENATGNFTKVVQRVPVRIALPKDVLEKQILRPGLSVVVTADRRDAEAVSTETPEKTAESPPNKTARADGAE